MISMNESLKNWERELLEAVEAGQVREVAATEDVAPQSGYTYCACRDCPDTTVSSSTSKPELCGLCEEAGCTNHNNLPGFIAGYGLGYECQRDDAYGEC